MLEELRLLQSLIQVISQVPDFQSAIALCLRQICELTNWDYGEAWFPCPDHSILTCNTAWYDTPKLKVFRQARETLKFPPNIGLPGRVWTSGQPEWMEDILIQPDQAGVDVQLAQMVGFQSEFAVPILQGQRVVAVLNFFIAQAGLGKGGWLDLVRIVATQLGLAIAHKQLEAELRQQKDFSQAVIETSSAFFVAIDGNGKTLVMNQGLLQALGYTLDQIVGTDYLSTFIPESERELLGKNFQQLIQDQQPILNESSILTKQGRKLLVEWRSKPIFKANGELDFFFTVGMDITERRLAEQETARLASFPLLTPNPIVEMDLAGHVRYLNPEAMRLLPELLDGDLDHGFIAGIPSMAKLLQQKGSLRREIKIGAVYYEQVLHYVPEIDCIRIYAFDISNRKWAEEQLIHNAFYDQLTGLANRALFMDRLKQAVSRTQQHYQDALLAHSYKVAVLFLNLNRFKIVNESLGSQSGDQLLQDFARRLQKCLRPSDTLARLSGDEFAILLDGLHDVSEAIRVAETIHQSLTSPFYLKEREVFMSASIGIALNTTNNHSILQAEDLLRNADLAMYRARLQGKSCYEVFHTGMYTNTADKLQMETDLRRGIERQEFRVYYQPIVSLFTGKITGFEALLRWQHPQRGLVSPSEFIPIAEETGLINPIGWWTLREACQQLSIWQQQFKSSQPLTMNVNLSCKQFSQPDLLSHIDQILEETKLINGSLKLEITESVVMDNPDLVRDLIIQLKKRNIHLCIDDFGTGYSSLSRLHHFPISTLKIDRSFVSRIGAFGENSEIVQAIVRLAQTLSMDVVAEGIEVSEQISSLINLQCEYGQGYFFSKPVDSKAAAKLLMAEWCQRI